MTVGTSSCRRAPRSNRSWTTDEYWDGSSILAFVTEDHFGELSVKSLRWAQVDIGDLTVDPSQLLTVRGAPCPSRGIADPKGRFGDIIGTYYGSLFVVTASFRETIEAAGLSGWGLLHLDIEGNESLKEGWLLQVFGVCGPMRMLGSFEYEVDLEGWDGADFFVPAGSSGILLSPHAREILSGARLRNVGTELRGTRLV